MFLRMRPTILAAEADPAVLAILERELAPAGYDLFIARHAVAAARRLRDCTPDLLVVAEHLPGGDGGLQLVAGLVAECEMPCVPVLFLAHSAGFAARAHALGAACLARPLSGSRLLEYVRRLSVRRPSHPALRSSRRAPAWLGAG